MELELAALEELEELLRALRASAGGRALPPGGRALRSALLLAEELYRNGAGILFLPALAALLPALAAGAGSLEGAARARLEGLIPALEEELRRIVPRPLLPAGGPAQPLPVRLAALALPRLAALEDHAENGGRVALEERAIPDLLEGLAALEGGLRLLEDQPDPALAARLRRALQRQRCGLARARIVGDLEDPVAALEEGAPRLTPPQRAELRLRWRALAAPGGELEGWLLELEEGAPLLAPGELEGRGRALALALLRRWRDRDLWRRWSGGAGGADPGAGAGVGRAGAGELRRPPPPHFDTHRGGPGHG